MQAELDLTYPELDIDLVVVNAVGYESGLDDLYAETDLPVLQDDEKTLVWDAWDAAWRDTYVVDGDNELREIYNLTEHNLADPEEYQGLIDLLVAAATD